MWSRNLFWLNYLLFKPVIMGVFAYLLPAVASEVEINQATETNQLSVSKVVPNSATNSENIGQLNSVSQLSDVRPTDWAFQALQSLIERYECSTGYPNQTYQGNRALSRYEFAAELSACLDQISQLITKNTGVPVSKEDFAMLQKLQEQYGTELKTVRSRIDALETCISTLESRQSKKQSRRAETIRIKESLCKKPKAKKEDQKESLCKHKNKTEKDSSKNSQKSSKRIKVKGEIVFGLTGIFGSDRAIDTDAQNRGDTRKKLDDNFILNNRFRLTSDISLMDNGEDHLKIRVQGRNIIPVDTNITGTNQTRVGVDGNDSNRVKVSVVSYKFPLGKSTNVTLGARGLEYDTEVQTLSPLFDSSGSGGISRYGRYNPIYRSTSGTGVIVNHELSKGRFNLSAGYVVPSSTASDPNTGKGIFNGTYAALAQLTFGKEESGLSSALTYVNAYYSNGSGVTGSTGTSFANNPFNGAGTSVNSYSLSVKYMPKNCKFVVTAWGGYTNAQAKNTTVARSNADIWNWAIQLGFPGLGGTDNFAGIVFGAPPYVASNQYLVNTNRRQDKNPSYHLEVFYKYHLNDKIAITPGLITIFNPEGNSNNPTTYVGVLRTTIKF